MSPRFVETTLAEFDLDPRSTALVVVDMQNDFCEPDGFFGRAGHDVSTCATAATCISGLLDGVRAAGIPIVWTKMIAGEAPQLKLPPIRFRAARDSETFVEGVGGTLLFAPGEWGSEIVQSLQVDPNDLVIEKPTYDAFFSTPLEEWLRAKKIDTLVFAGVTSHCCVDASVRAAFVRGFNVLVLSDCVAAFGQEVDLNDSTLEVLALLFAVVAPSGAFAEAIAVHAA
jgi:nicotinamidase-related amidase